ncbi:MAG: restriction endonuclease subunit S [Bryobacteraceae bacterium]
MEHVEAHTMRLLACARACEMKSAAVHFLPGDVLYGRLRPYLNKVLRPQFEGLASAEFIVFAPSPAIDQQFLQYTLNSGPFVSFASHLNEGDRPRVDFEQIGSFGIALPPLAEQRRIVAEIETELARLDAALLSLRRAKANVRRLRTCVISSALRWNSWPKAALGIVIEGIEAGKNFRCEERPPNAGEVGVVKVSAVSWGQFDENASKTCPSTDHFEVRHLIHPGDFLISRANTVELVGACVIVGQVTRRLMLSDKILRLIPCGVEPAWLLHALRSPQGRQQIEARATGNQESMRNISQESIKAIEIPLPSRSEQIALLAAVERALSRADAAEAVLDACLRRAAALRQAVLKKAFEGELVPQDPNDEPASVLLERIRATHAQRKRDAHA